jgi:hypothetical protein
VIGGVRRARKSARPADSDPKNRPEVVQGLKKQMIDRPKQLRGTPGVKVADGLVRWETLYNAASSKHSRCMRYPKIYQYLKICRMVTLSAANVSARAAGKSRLRFSTSYWTCSVTEERVGSVAVAEEADLVADPHRIKVVQVRAPRRSRWNRPGSPVSLQSPNPRGER